MGTQTSGQDLEDCLRNLNDTLNKDEGIVNTSSSQRFINQPESIEQQYTEYARTHLVQPDVESFIESLTTSLSDPDDDRSVPGYIVGPYGYGKTSSAGKVWHVLERENDYIATPPIYFKNLQSIVDAVYGWMRYRLQDRADYLEELERCYEANAADNIKDLLEQTNLADNEDFRSGLERLIESGAVDIEFSVSNVLDFLSECNQIARDAGYDGLVVIADELQQFVSNHTSDKEAYAELRDIAKSIALGLTEGDGLGILFTMDEGLHSDLDVNADDVLARLSEQNVNLNLSNVYGRDFPEALWEDLSSQYGFSGARYEIISKDALDAMGQICERGPPLSNGPRTVVDFVTIGIDHWLSNDEPFDALHLANSYYNGVVRYKGDKIKSAITEAINAEIINTPSRENFIKLCGVFPRGVSDELLEAYGVYEAKEGVKNELHGQLIITHEEGRTLKSLEREGEERGIKDELFTQFYRKYDTTELHNDRAARIFRDELIESELFPSVRGRSLDSWVTEHSFEPETGGVHTGVFRGSFNGQRYPERILEVRTGPSVETVTSGGGSLSVDFQLGFVLTMESESDVTPHLERPEADEVVFVLDFMDSFESLPSNIALLEDYMSPEDVNPHLLLSLYDYMESWQEEQTVNPNQEQQLEYIQDQILNQTIQQLFGSPLNGDDLVSEGGSSRRTVQPSKVVATVFNSIIEEVYPDYTTLFVSDNYDTFLDDYESLLLGHDPDLRISQKRGNTPISGIKSDIAEALGVSNNSTAKTRLNKQFADLTEVEVWSGTDARIQLTLHPLEERLKAALEDASDERLSYQEAYDIGAEYGHRKEEVDWALRLLDAREYIDRYQGEYVELSDIAIGYEEVKQRYEGLAEEAEAVADVSENWTAYLQEIDPELEDIEDRLAAASVEDIEILDDILASLQDLQQNIDSQMAVVEAKIKERCESKKSDLEDIKTASKPRALKKDAEGSSVPFEMHLKDIKTRLNKELQEVQKEARDGATDLRTARNSINKQPSIENINALQTAHAESKELEDELNERIEAIETEAEDYASWCKLAREMGTTRSKMVRYKQSHDNPGEVTNLLDQLDAQLAEIQQDFQRDQASALSNAEVERANFSDIADRFDRITQGDRDDFTYRKRVLENTLKGAKKGSGTIRQSLDPEDPQESRNDLHHHFLRQLREESGGLNDLRAEIDRLRGNLEYAKLLKQIPENPARKPADLEADFDEYTALLDDIEQAVEELQIKNNIPLPADDERSESFPKTDRTLSLHVADDILSIGTRIDQLREEIGETEEIINRWRSTTDEPPEDLIYIMKELDYRQTTDIESVLVEIAENQSVDIGLEAFFDDLRKLFEGNHVIIKLKSEHR